MPSEAQYEEIRKDSDVRTAAAAAHAVQDVIDTAGWTYLTKRFSKYPEAVYRRIAARLLRGEEIVQRELDFSRGYATAIADMISTPERVEQELEKAAENAYRRLQQQEQKATGPDAPYE